MCNYLLLFRAILIIEMVLLTLTPAAKAAVEEYCRLKREVTEDEGGEGEAKLEHLSKVELGNPVDHSDLIDISRYLVRKNRKNDEDAVAREWRLDALLKGALVYQPPPTPKPEPVSLMKGATATRML